MKLVSLLNEYSGGSSYIHGIQFKVLINVSQSGLKIYYIAKNSAQAEKLDVIGKEIVAKTIKNNLESKLAMSFERGDKNDAGISFITTFSQIEEHILLMLK